MTKEVYKNHKDRIKANSLFVNIFKYFIFKLKLLIYY